MHTVYPFWQRCWRCRVFNDPGWSMMSWQTQDDGPRRRFSCALPVPLMGMPDTGSAMIGMIYGATIYLLLHQRLPLEINVFPFFFKQWMAAYQNLFSSLRSRFLINLSPVTRTSPPENGESPLVIFFFLWRAPAVAVAFSNVAKESCFYYWDIIFPHSFDR